MIDQETFEEFIYMMRTFNELVFIKEAHRWGYVPKNVDHSDEQAKDKANTSNVNEEEDP